MARRSNDRPPWRPTTANRGRRDRDTGGCTGAHDQGAVNQVVATTALK